MRAGPTRGVGGGYWKLAGIWRAVVRAGCRKVGWDVVGAGSQSRVYVYCSTAQREAFLHSPPLIVTTDSLDQFAHSLTNQLRAIARL